RVLPERREDGGAVRPAPHPRERLEHGHVRLARAVLLDALSVRDQHVIARAEAGQERFHERRLADPGLAGDEDELAPTGARRLERPTKAIELCVAADQRGEWH